MRFGPLSQTNGYVIEFNFVNYNSNHGTVSSFDNSGSMTVVTNWTQTGANRNYARPSGDPIGNWFNAETTPSLSPYIARRGTNGVLLETKGLASAQWVLAGDSYGGAHAADDNGHLFRYDYDGNLVWTLNMPALVNVMILDGQGNRFFSLNTGTLGRLGNETVFGPTITNAPQGLTILAGSNATFTASATGSGPLSYYWQFNGAPINGATTTMLNLADVQSSQAGLYTLVASNFVNCVTSAPAQLRVQSVAVFYGNQILTNGTYTFGTPPTFTIGCAYTNPSVFYTLDGSTPTFASISYAGPFVLTSNAVIRALAYSSDFSQSAFSDTVNVIVYGTHTLTATTAGGGTVSLNPPGGTYSSTNVVTATATPASGYTFLYWQGDASSYNSSVQVTMERDKAIQAVFGTTLNLTPPSGGQIQAVPSQGLYPYGSVVRLTAIPQSGEYFAIWGANATGSGGTNPLYFTVTNATPTVSALFQPLSAGQAALTVLLNGPGQVNVNPSANVYSTNASVILTANPYPGKGFVGWSGDASGSQNPLAVAMTQSKVITAIFTNWPGLYVDKAQGDGLGPQGFQFSIVSGTQMVYQVYASSNWTSWSSVGFVTNSNGTVQFTDTGATNRSSSYYKAVAQ